MPPLEPSSKKARRAAEIDRKAQEKIIKSFRLVQGDAMRHYRAVCEAVNRSPLSARVRFAVKALLRCL